MNNYAFIRPLLLVCSLFTVTLINGCSSPQAGEVSYYNLHFQAHPLSNNSAPLKVRVLLLKSDAELMSSDFFTLQTNAQKALGANLLNSDEFFLMPGTLTKKLTGQSSPEARYIGVISEYQSLDGKKWRVSLPLPIAGEKSFWSFWTLSANELQANIFLDINGLRVVQQ